MVIYRPHRGSFKDAMGEAKVFATVEDMKEYVAASWEIDGVRMFEENDIVIGEESMNDTRNGWVDTRYVCVNRIGSEVYEIPQCIGMCATEFPEKQKRPPSE